MKKFLVVALAALCVVALLPQNLAAGVGIKGGLSLSKFSTEPADAFPFPLQNLTGRVGGLFFSLGLGPLSIQPEILYARMGVKGEYEGATIENRLDYIQVPLLLKIRVIPAGPIRPVVFAGGYGSFILNAKGVMSSEGATVTIDMDDMFEKYDYGVVAGAGLEFKLPGLMLSVEGRYNFGLANIAKDAEAGEWTKNRSLMALVGIGF